MRFQTQSLVLVRPESPTVSINIVMEVEGSNPKFVEPELGYLDFTIRQNANLTQSRILTLAESTSIIAENLGL